MESHDVTSTVLIHLLYTTFLAFCSPMQTLQSNESILSSFNEETVKSGTGFDQLASFTPSSNYIFTNNSNGAVISASVVSIDVDYSIRMSNDYEATAGKTLDSMPGYSLTLESVSDINSSMYSGTDIDSSMYSGTDIHSSMYSGTDIHSSMYSGTWIPAYSSAVFATSSDIYHLTLVLESSFLPSSLAIPIMSFVTGSFVQSVDGSVLKHQSYDSYFETPFLDHTSAHLEASDSVKSLNIVNAGEMYPSSSRDILVIPTGITDTLKSSFATSATGYSLPYSTSLRDDKMPSFTYINITDEIQGTYLNAPNNSLKSNTIEKATKSFMEQWNGWIQPTSTQTTQIETESLDSVLSASNSRSRFVTTFTYVVDEDEISDSVQSSSLIRSCNLKFDTSDTEAFTSPSPVDGSFQTIESMYTTGMMDDDLSKQTNTVVTSIHNSVTDFPFFSNMPNTAFFSSSHPHASTDNSIQANSNTLAAQDISRSDPFSFTADDSVQNVSGGNVHTRPVSIADTAAELYLSTDSVTKFSASPTNLTPSQTSLHAARSEETSRFIGPSFSKSSTKTHEIYKTSAVEVDNSQNWEGQGVLSGASNPQNEVSVGTKFELFIVIGAIVGFAVVVLVFVVIVCFCKQCCNSNPQSVGVKIPLKNLKTRVDVANKAKTMTHFVKVAPMQVMKKRKVFVDA